MSATDTPRTDSFDNDGPWHEEDWRLFASQLERDLAACQRELDALRTAEEINHIAYETLRAEVERLKGLLREATTPDEGGWYLPGPPRRWFDKARATLREG